MPTNTSAVCIAENRACSRYQLSLPVLFAWAGEAHNQSAGFTRDIGVGGAFIFSQLCPPSGAEVKVELVLPLPDDGGRELRFRCIGKVIRLEAHWPQGQGFAIAGDFGREYYSELARAWRRKSFNRFRSSDGARRWGKLVRANESEVCGKVSENWRWRSLAALASDPNHTMPIPNTNPEFAGRQWMAVYTIPRHEKQVSHQIEQRSLECFLPLYESVRRWKTGPTRVCLPLFPGYVFVRADLMERRKVIELPSVIHIIGNRTGPAVLPDAEIEQLRRTVATRRVQPHSYLTAGSRVRIASGPLAGMEGLLVKKKGGLKVVLSVELIRQSIAVEVNSCDIESCTPARIKAA
jgi:transcription antitermination factor NusG